MPTQCVIRPGLEPVYSAAVDEGGEHPHPVSECVSNGTEGQDDVQVLSTPVHKVVEQRERCMLCILVVSLGKRPHSLQQQQQQPCTCMYQLN